MDKLPEKVDLSLKRRMPPVYDQGELGSSSACATCYATEWMIMNPSKDKSKLFAYHATIYEDFDK